MFMLVEYFYVYGDLILLCLWGLNMFMFMLVEYFYVYQYWILYVLGIEYFYVYVGWIFLCLLWL